jgi:hypothetical protein
MRLTMLAGSHNALNRPTTFSATSRYWHRHVVAPDSDEPSADVFLWCMEYRAV